MSCSFFQDTSSPGTTGSNDRDYTHLETRLSKVSNGANETVNRAVRSAILTARLAILW